MPLLIGLGAFIAIVIASYRGVGYRGLYVAGAIFSLVAGVGCIGLVPSAAEHAAAIEAGDQATIEGSRVLLNYGFDLAVVWFAIAFGSVMGSALFRQRPAAKQPDGLRE